MTSYRHGFGKFKIGDRVDKVSGYRFPGTVCAVFFNSKQELRYVVELDGMLHIFNEEQLKERR